MRYTRTCVSMLCSETRFSRWGLSVCLLNAPTSCLASTRMTGVNT